MVGDLISRSALLKAIEGVEVSFYLDDGVCGDNYDDTTIVDIINKQPTIEAVPVVHGEWIKEENTWICSVCHKENACAYDEILHRFTDFFCPKCGADMRKGGAE